MDPLSKKRNKNLTIGLAHHEMLSAWSSVKKMIELNIPTTPSDVAFLGQLLTTIAKGVDEHKKDEEFDTTPFKLKMKLPQWISLWHCCNVMVQNNLYSNKGQEAAILQVMSVISPRIDEELSRPATKLTLVE